MATSKDGNPSSGDKTKPLEQSVEESSDGRSDDSVSFWSSLLQASLSAKTGAAKDISADTVVSDITEAETYLDAYRKEEEQKHRQREYMTPALRNIACGWILAVIVILFYQGLRAWGFNLSDKVLITLLTTTSVNVLGLFLIALNYLYPKHGRWRPAKKRLMEPEPSSGG